MTRLPTLVKRIFRIKMKALITIMDYTILTQSDSAKGTNVLDPYNDCG